jgi:hypothetical protein
MFRFSFVGGEDGIDQQGFVLVVDLPPRGLQLFSGLQLFGHENCV